MSFPPEGFSLQWYERMLTDRQWSAGIVNSLEVAVLTAILATVLGTLAALGLTRGRFPGRNIVNAIALAPLIVPVVIIAIGMFSLFVQWRISGSLLGLVLAHTALALPFVIVSVGTSLRTMDRNLELAAANLGADPRRSFMQITLPIILPGVLTGAIWMAYPVKGDGTIGPGRVFFDATRGVKTLKGLPDGLKVDKDGNLFATGPGGVLVFAPDGTHLGTLNTGEATANVGFGDDGSTLYITADMYLARVKTKTRGRGF